MPLRPLFSVKAVIPVSPLNALEPILNTLAGIFSVPVIPVHPWKAELLISVILDPIVSWDMPTQFRNALEPIAVMASPICGIIMLPAVPVIVELANVLAGIVVIPAGNRGGAASPENWKVPVPRMTNWDGNRLNGGNIIVRDTQFWKIELPIVVTVSGRVIDGRARQLKNAKLPIIVNTDVLN